VVGNNPTRDARYNTPSVFSNPQILLDNLSVHARGL